MRCTKLLLVLFLLSVLAGCASAPKSPTTKSPPKKPVRYVIWPRFKQEENHGEVILGYLDEAFLAKRFNSPVAGKALLQGTYYFYGLDPHKKLSSTLYLCASQNGNLGEVEKTKLASIQIILPFNEKKNFYEVPFSLSCELQKQKEYWLALKLDGEPNSSPQAKSSDSMKVISFPTISDEKVTDSIIRNWGSPVEYIKRTGPTGKKFKWPRDTKDTGIPVALEIIPVAEKSASQRQLPTSDEEAVAAAIVRYELQQTRGSKEAFYISLYGEDPSDDFMRQFRREKRTRKISQASERKNPREGIPLWLDSYQWQGPDKVTVSNIYVATDYHVYDKYTLQKHAGKWVVTGKKDRFSANK